MRHYVVCLMHSVFLFCGASIREHIHTLTRQETFLPYSSFNLSFISTCYRIMYFHVVSPPRSTLPRCTLRTERDRDSIAARASGTAICRVAPGYFGTRPLFWRVTNEWQFGGWFDSCGGGGRWESGSQRLHPVLLQNIGQS